MTQKNHYGELVEVARGLSLPEAFSGWPYDPLSGPASDELLQRNGALLPQAQALLQLPASVPLWYDAAFFQAHMDDVCALRHLARVWALQCDRARFQGRKELAAQAVRNLLRLANVSRQGGLMTDLLVSDAIAGSGLSRLRKMRQVMPADGCAAMAGYLLAWDGDRESFQAVAKRDAEWERVVELTPSAAPALLETPDDPALAELQETTTEAFRQMMELPPFVQEGMKERLDHKFTSVARLLTVDLALRAAMQNDGEVPTSLEALVPEYLREIPSNPFCSAPMVYRPLATQYKLYFVGPSGQNHGGQFGDWNSVDAGQADVGVDIDDLPLTLAPTTKHSPAWKAVGDKILSAIHRLGERYLTN